MIDKLAMISGLIGPTSADGLKAGAVKKPVGEGEGSFTDIIGKMLDSASLSANKADDLSKRLQMDDPTASVEDSVLAMNTSSLQFTGVVQARNKVLQAYNDIMNMPV